MAIGFQRLQLPYQTGEAIKASLGRLKVSPLLSYNPIFSKFGAVSIVCCKPKAALGFNYFLMNFNCGF